MSKLLNDCLMCEHRDYTWFEVLRDTCGLFEPSKAIEKLCDVHRQIVSEQVKERFNQ